jgi:hypothetical protein
MSPRRTFNPHAPLELAARALHEAVILPFHHIQEGQDPVDSGRYRNWFDLPEEGREVYRRKARKAAESATFAEYYDWVTLAERLAPEDSLYVAKNGRPPAHDEDTERTRGHRAEYYLVQHLLRVEDPAPEPHDDED